MSESASALGTPVVSYQPLTRMQEKAAQLRAELEAASKSERHAQFKRSSSKGVGLQGATALSGAGQSSLLVPQSSSSPGRRFLRTANSNVHSVHSVSTLLPGGSGGGNSGGNSGGGGGGGGGSYERPPSASAVPASRLPSRRVSNASGAATDVSGDEMRTTNSGAKSPPSRRPSRPSRVSMFRDSPDYAAAISRQNQLEDNVAELEDQVRELAADNERRQESYMRREAALQEELTRMEGQLRKARGEQPQSATTFGKAASNMRELHNHVVSQIEDLLTVQAASVRNEEHTTLRRFTTRLSELEAAVVAERNKAAAREDVDAADKIKGLRTELDNMQHIAMLLDKKHTLLSEENSRLRAQFSLQEDDRDYLIRQTVALKKENGALRNQLAALMEEVATLHSEKEELAAALSAGGGGGDASGGSSLLTLGVGAAAGWGGAARPGSAAAAMATRPGSSRGGGGGGGADTAIQIKIQRYEDVIESLKRLLEAERRRTKQARSAHTLELQQRTGLQALLRQCVEDVRERRKAMEADERRERTPADAARLRPASAARPPLASTPIARPLSATTMLLPSNRRPASAASPVHSPGGHSPGGRLGGVGVGYVAAAAAAAGIGEFALDAGARAELIETLLSNEEVLRVLFDKAFPGVSPHPPSDPYLERMAAWQEHRDAQVAANAKVLAAAKNAVLPPATAVKESTPGGMLLKEAANRPWVLNVDAMLSDFLGGTGGGGGGGGPAGGPSSKSVGGLSAASAGGGAGIAGS